MLEKHYVKSKSAKFIIEFSLSIFLSLDDDILDGRISFPFIKARF